MAAIIDEHLVSRLILAQMAAALVGAGVDVRAPAEPEPVGPDAVWARLVGVDYRYTERDDLDDTDSAEVTVSVSVGVGDGVSRDDLIALSALLGRLRRALGEWGTLDAGSGHDIRLGRDGPAESVEDAETDEATGVRTGAFTVAGVVRRSSGTALEVD